MFQSRYIELLNRAFVIANDGGIRKLFWRSVPFAYDLLHPHLPAVGEYGIYNGVIVGQKSRLLDTSLPKAFSKTHDPDYEKNYVSLIRKYVNVGDEVVVVGGGLGVSSVAAAHQVYRPGNVTTFEGSTSEVEKTRKSVELNGVSERVDVQNAIVGKEVKLRGEAGEPPVIDPADLPKCDVLALDCDGSEKMILENLDDLPSLLIVEHHAVWNEGRVDFEYQPASIERIIEGKGYDIIHEETMSSKGTVEYDLKFYVARLE